jgi:hypothetical protein
LPTARLRRASEVEASRRRCTALIERRCGRTSDLLHVLAWASVLPFTRDSVRSGVFTWGWLMAARSAAERDARRVLHVFEQRSGLFAADEALRSVNMLASLAAWQRGEQRLSAGRQAPQRR